MGANTSIEKLKSVVNDDFTKLVEVATQHDIPPGTFPVLEIVEIYSTYQRGVDIVTVQTRLSGLYRYTCVVLSKDVLTVLKRLIDNITKLQQAMHPCN